MTTGIDKQVTLSPDKSARRFSPLVKTHVPASLESLPVFHRQNKRQCDQGSHSLHLLKEHGFRIFGPGDLLNFDVAFVDLFGQRFNFLDHGQRQMWTYPGIRPPMWLRQWSSGSRVCCNSAGKSSISSTPT